jgi:branched-chain amino acid transport system permease protein
VVVGGFKSIYGMFFGAFIIHGMSELFLKDWLGDVSTIFSGILLIVVILFYPKGIAHIWVDIKKLYYKIKYRNKEKDVISDES